MSKPSSRPSPMAHGSHYPQYPQPQPHRCVPRWDNLGNIVGLRHDLAWELNLPPDSVIILYDEAGARNPYASLVQERRPNVHMCSFREHAAEPPLNYSTPDKAFLVEDYYEYARSADGDPLEIPRTPTDVSVPQTAGLVVSLRSSSTALLTRTDGRACDGGYGGQRHGRHTLATSASGGPPTSAILERAPSLTQHEVPQKIFKSPIRVAREPPRMSGGGDAASGTSVSDMQTDPDAGSGMENG